MASKTMRNLTTPAGMSGLAIEPWTPGEVYAVAADWAQAAATVWSYADGRWVPTGRQVADYRHDPRAALLRELRETLEASGDDPDDADNLIDDATEIG